ncbi:MAG: hypothetical protein ACM3XN_11175 [Chloroflexota bacterium]
MSESSSASLQRVGHELAVAWRAPLEALSQRWQSEAADWERIFPGLVAAIGLQSLVWPRWVSLARAAEAAGTAGAPGATGVGAAYVEPPAGADVLRFAFGPASGSVAWIAVAAPGTEDWQRIRAAFADRDVLLSLATLTEQDKIVFGGRATGLLAPLIGRTLPGDQPVGLPVCDCQAIERMLPDWQASVEALEPTLAEAAAHLRHNSGGVGDSSSDALATTYGQLAWGAWQALLDAGVIRLTGGRAVAGKSLLGRLLGPRELPPFRGAMLLRGDHWALWQAIKGNASR